ncbi:hypothetical protein FRX97_10950 [Luteibaculum oceani]|uniref:Uncharacterized protein n=2 Tax=Luteibaculum oceani TaxID=1294296 RepID=A0A5C6UVU7_9FLAO|nr:hypothetical protein FRX97_10950 [Luteibaculum oceani]
MEKYTQCGNTSKVQMEFLQHLQNGSLPISEFTHHAHIELAWIMLQANPVQDAMEKVSQIILNYVKKLGAAAKFNRALTQNSVLLISKRMHKDLDFEGFKRNNEDLFDDFKKALMLFSLEGSDNRTNTIQILK